MKPIIYTANKTNFNFYKEGEAHTKQEWMSKLGISETQFAAIADSDFTASSSTVFICEIQDSTIVIRSEKGTLSDDEISSLMKPVQILLSQFNNQ